MEEEQETPRCARQWLERPGKLLRWQQQWSTRLCCSVRAEEERDVCVREMSEQVKEETRRQFIVRERSSRGAKN